MARSVVVAAVASLLLVPISRAQEPPSLGRHLSLVVGPLFVSQRDENASPLRYGGVTPFLQFAYATRMSRRTFELRVGGTGGTLRSALTQDSDLPHQKTGRGWVELEYARLLGDPDGRTRWFLGGLFAARGTTIVHVYAPGGADAAYAYFGAMIGPVIAMERASGERATLRARLSVPAIALVGRPYSVFHALYREPRPSADGLRFRFASVDAFQAADFTTTYTVVLRRRADLVLGYHLMAERYLGPQPFRFASQGVSLALALRTGGDR